MLKPGDEPVPGYRLEAFLGKGQFGEVWKARSPGGASAALKFLDLGGRAGWKEFRAIQRVKAIRHANLMPITALWVLDLDGNVLDDTVIENFAPDDPGQQVTDTARADQANRATMAASGSTAPVPRQLVVASLLGDLNLLEKLAEHQEASGEPGLPADDLLDYMEQAAKGIDFLNMRQHDLGSGPVAIQHCDVKPANIMLVGDSVLVCDFGLASVLGESQMAATATNMVGSLAYMSPECSARKAGAASDQYSLAVSYYELRTGELPFKDQSQAEVLLAIRQGSLDFSRVGSAEQKVLRRATAVEAEDRYPTASDMVADLRRTVDPGDGRRQVPQSNNLASTFAVTVGIGGLILATMLYVFWDDSVTYTIRVQPADMGVRVSVNDQRLEPLAEGEFKFDHDETEVANIQASFPPDYQDWSGQVERDDDRTITIRLELTNESLRAQAEQAMATDWDRAVALWAELIGRDRGFASPPEAVPVADLGVTLQIATLGMDRKWLALGTHDGTIQVLKVEASGGAWKTVSNLSLDGPVTALAGAANWLAASFQASDSRAEIAVFDDLTGQPQKPIATFEAGAYPLDCPIGMSHNQQWLVYPTADGGDMSGVQFVELDSRRATRGPQIAPTGFLELITHVFVSGDGAWAVTKGVDEPIWLWERANRSVVALEQKAAFAVCYDPDHDVLVYASQQETNRYRVQMRAMRSGQVQQLPGELPDDVDCLQIEGDRLAAATVGGQIYVWNLQSRQQPALQLPEHQSAVGQLLFVHQGKRLVSVDNRAGSWELWNLESKNVNETLRADVAQEIVHCFVVEDQLLVAAMADGKVLAWDLTRAALIQEAKSQ